MGFADGFRTGYGLVADNQDRELKKTQLDNAQSNADRNFKAAEDERRVRAGERSADLTRMTTNEGLAAEERKTAQAFRQKTQTDNDAFRISQLGLQKESLANKEANDSANRAKAKGIFDRQTTDLDRQDKERTKNEATIAAGNAANDLLSFKFPETGLSDQDAGEFNTAIAKTNNSVLSVPLAINPFNQEVAQNISSDLQKFSRGEDLTNKENIIGGAEMLLQKNTKGIGEIIPATVAGQPHPYPNSPPAFRTGEYEIIGKQAYDVSARPDGSIGITVLVRVKDKQGQISSYLAPVTESRDAGGLGVSIGVEDFAGGFAGMVHLSNEMSKNKPDLYRAMAEAQYRKNGEYDRPSYVKALNEAEATFDANLEFRQEQKVMQGSNRTFGDIASNPKLKEEYIKHQLLTGDSIPINYRDETAGQIAVARSQSAVTKLEALRKRKSESKGETYTPLSDAQIMEARTYMGLGKNEDIVIDDSKGWNRFQSKIYGSRVYGAYGTDTPSIPATF